MVAVGFQPTDRVAPILPVPRRVATIEILNRRYATRKCGCVVNRGLKPTATIRGRYATKTACIPEINRALGKNPRVDAVSIQVETAIGVMAGYNSIGGRL